jgi:DNA-binding NarL/FixJ family response regulator
MTKLRILVADDHDVVRRGLRAILEAEPGWEVVADVANGRGAVERSRELAPDVAVVDVSMPELSGFEATRRLLEVSPDTKVLILSMHESDEVIREAVKAGARGYVLKSDAGRDLVAALRAVAAGRTFFTSRVTEIVVKGAAGEPYPGPRDAARQHELTARERDVIRLLAQGRSHKQVADALGIRPKTVETHRANVSRKLRLKSASDLVRYAIRHNLIPA